MRIPDFKNLELKHVTFSKGYDDKDTLKDFVKIRHYFDELEDYEISIDKRKKKEFTEKELDEGISIEMNNKDMAYFLILLNGKDIGFTSIRYSPNLEIIALFIDKEYRNKGYGAQIIHRLEKILWNNRGMSKGKEIQIITGTNNYKAQKLYMSLGYTEYKRNELYVFYNKKEEDIL